MIYGNQGADTLSGGLGNDEIYGGQGSDLIYGGSGDDTINGNNGPDDLWGGDGSDMFVFAIGGGPDVIHDFDLGTGTGTGPADSIVVVGGSTGAVTSMTSGGNTIITFGAEGSVTLIGVTGFDLGDLIFV